MNSFWLIGGWHFWEGVGVTCLQEGRDHCDSFRPLCRLKQRGLTTTLGVGGWGLGQKIPPKWALFLWREIIVSLKYLKMGGGVGPTHCDCCSQVTDCTRWLFGASISYSAFSSHLHQTVRVLPLFSFHIYVLCVEDMDPSTDTTVVLIPGVKVEERIFLLWLTGSERQFCQCCSAEQICFGSRLCDHHQNVVTFVVTIDVSKVGIVLCNGHQFIKWYDESGVSKWRVRWGFPSGLIYTTAEM